ncbi:MAG: arsenic efflux protein [Deltaproteobacteria bacterium]|jgi:hypothetical protein|nr:arsenic efflux protein [Deltaproteobacteria bacterium]
MELVSGSLKQALMITGFVFVMMLVIESVNVLGRKFWQKRLPGGAWQQYVFAALMGVTPGCLGAFAVVSLYLHGMVSPGAVVAAMIATSGDEAFVMLSMVPDTAGWLFLVLFAVGVISGVLTDRLPQNVFGRWSKHCSNHQTHEHESCACTPTKDLLRQIRECNVPRGVLLITLGLFIVGVCTGLWGPDTWNWLRWTLLITAGAALLVVLTVPNEFLENHLWKHVFLTHIPRIFIWTFAALLLIGYLIDTIDLANWLQRHQTLLLFSACLLGLIPESGPHLVFLTLYSQNLAPFSLLLASSIVQDGHGMLPLLAESRGDFLKIKGINFAIGLLIGLIGLWVES